MWLNEKYTILYGVFNKKEMVGKSELILDQQLMAEVKQILNLEKYKVCQIRRVLDKPEYRHRSILNKMLTLQVKTAKEMAFNYIVAYVHPEDVECKTAIRRAKFEYVKTTKLKNGMEREFYIIKV